MKKDGFTLIEILVVLGIIALMYATVAPMLGNTIDNSRVKSSMRELAAGLKTARSRAVSAREETRFIVDTMSRTYMLGEKLDKLDLPEEAGLVLTTAKSEQIDEHTGAIRFYTDGSSTGGRITLSMGPAKYVVDINWLTGKIVLTP